MVMGHAVDLQVFDTDDTVRVDDLTTVLMGEVVTSEGDTLMHPCNSFPMFPAFGCPFGKFAMLALNFGKGLLFLAEKPGVLYLSSIRHGSKGLESDINPDLRGAFRQSLRFTLHREGHIPLAGRGPSNSTRFHLPFDRAMIDHLDSSNLRNHYTIVILDAEATLGEREGVIAPIAFEPGIPRVLTSFATPEEGFERQVNTDGYILQDLRMHISERRTLLFHYRECRLLLVEGQPFASLLISLLTLFQQMIIQPTTLFQGPVKLRFLLSGWIYSILKHLTHIPILA